MFTYMYTRNYMGSNRWTLTQTKELETFANFWVKCFVNRTLHSTLNSFMDGLNALFPPKLPRNEAQLGGPILLQWV